MGLVGRRLARCPIPRHLRLNQLVLFAHLVYDGGRDLRRVKVADDRPWLDRFLHHGHLKEFIKDLLLLNSGQEWAICGFIDNAICSGREWGFVIRVVHRLGIMVITGGTSLSHL